MATPRRTKVRSWYDHDVFSNEIVVKGKRLLPFQANAEGLSAQVNAAIRHEIGRRRRQRALAELLERMETEAGPLDSPDDEAEITRFMRLLGGEA